MSVWRQGDLLRPEDAHRLDLVNIPDDARVVVVSHSCDLASSVEDSVEIIVGSRVDEAGAVYQNGHSIRLLSLVASAPDGGSDFSLFSMRGRRTISKELLEGCDPWDQVRYAKDQRELLRRWMAQRYSRSEFPNAFVAWLRESRVEERLERLAKRNSASLVGIYFDLQDDSERIDPDDPYQLGITVVYKEDVEGAEAASSTVAAELQSAFSARCKMGGRWRWIELLHCESASDLEFPLGAAYEFQRWRLEHRSMNGEPLPGEI